MMPVDAAAVSHAGEDPELDGLIAHFEHRVRSVTARVMRRWGLSESGRDDLVSAGYLGLLKALRNRRPGAHAHALSAYVSQRVEGAVIDEARTLIGRAHRLTVLDPLRLDVDPGGWGGEGAGGATAPSPEERAERGLRWRRVFHALDSLEEEERAVLLRLAGGESLAEVARDRGVSLSGLQSRLNRSIRRLRGRAPGLRRILNREI